MTELIDTTEQEKWRDIPGWEGLYQASSLGRIKSLPRRVRIGQGRWRTTRERVMKPGFHRDYFRIVLRRPAGEHTGYCVHQLVCRAFHPHPGGKVEVAHNDGVATNNRADNLRWATRLENALDKWEHGTAIIGEACRNSIMTEHDVREIRRQMRKLINAAAAVHGVSYSTMADIVHKRTWKHVK